MNVLEYLTKVDVPEGESGNYKVERFEVSDEDARFSGMRDIFSGQGHRSVPAGVYTRLIRKGLWGPLMSDTPAEIRDHYNPVRKACRDCLINGLGIGVVLQACLRKPEVDHVTVIEISEDVIRLVADHYYDKFGKDKLEIIQEDALEWKPPKGKFYGMVWHDIWPDICSDNWEIMKKLHRKYGRRSLWQGSWCRDEVKRAVQESKRRRR